MALIKQVESLMALLGPHKRAARKIYYNGVRVDEVPDELARHKNAVAILEWLEGKPRELQVQFRGDYDDLQKMLEDRMKSSPASQDFLQKNVQGKEIIQALPDATKDDGHSSQIGQSVKNAKNSFSS